MNARHGVTGNEDKPSPLRGEKRSAIGPALPASYVLPILSTIVVDDLDEYLGELSDVVEVIVVDGSDQDVFDAHERRWTRWARHLPVDDDLLTPMGKVGGVLTGVRHASFNALVIADDDVRWDASLLARAIERLCGVEVVRPQNWFRPTPWHARWDTGRILLNRAFGGDWPGTLVVDRRALCRVGGYDGSVLFENLELVRTIKAGGGRERLALDLLVPREPPPISQFFDQRVRQAYDEFARPWRLAVFLAVGPVVMLGGRRAAAVIALTSVVAAEYGRRRGGGRSVFGRTAAAWAPAWVAERTATSWLAVLSRVRHGGIRYRTTVLRRAATPMRELKRAHLSEREELGDPNIRFASKIVTSTARDSTSIDPQDPSEEPTAGNDGQGR